MNLADRHDLRELGRSRIRGMLGSGRRRDLVNAMRSTLRRWRPNTHAPSSPAPATVEAAERDKPSPLAERVRRPRIPIQIRPVTVVVPIYNAVEHVQACLESIVEHTVHPDVELLLIDDASPDPRVGPLLDSFQAEYRSIEVLRNEQNLGFLRTMNRGFDHAVGRDVVMLNSDTIVTSRWLLGLCAAASEPTTGTVTALSNNAWAFSAPAIGFNELPASADETARAIRQRAERRYPETPSGHGFCMLVKRAVLDDIGGFDELFGRGYCEENDLCMRARALGWRHVVDDATLVEHRGSVSFADAKPALLAANRATLDERFPEYTELIEAFVASTEMAIVRERVAEVFDDIRASPTLPRVLHVLDRTTEGHPRVADLIRQASDRYESLVLRVAGTELTLTDSLTGVELDRARLTGHSADDPSHHDPVGGMIAHHAIEIVHAHLQPASFDLLSIAAHEQVPVIASLFTHEWTATSVDQVDALVADGPATAEATRDWLPGSAAKVRIIPEMSDVGSWYAQLCDDVRGERRSFLPR
jgi:GT2 family glycosyltransferase